MMENETIFTALMLICALYVYILATSGPDTDALKPFILANRPADQYRDFLSALQAERGYSNIHDGFEGGGGFGDGATTGGRQRRRRRKGPSDVDDFLLDIGPNGGKGGFDGGSEWESAYKYDDVWGRGGGGGGGGWDREQEEAEEEPIEEVDKPSEHFLCRPGFVTLRSNTNFKYLWMQDDSGAFMTATAAVDTPLFMRAFEVVPVDPTCSDGGRVMLRDLSRGAKGYASDSLSDGPFIFAVPPVLYLDAVAAGRVVAAVSPPSTSASSSIGSNNGGNKGASGDIVLEGGAAAGQDSSDPSLKVLLDAASFHDDLNSLWTVKPGTSSESVARADARYHFVLEMDGYVYNMASKSFVNVITQSDYRARMHSSRGTLRKMSDLDGLINQEMLTSRLNSVYSSSSISNSGSSSTAGTGAGSSLGDSSLSVAADKVVIAESEVEMLMREARRARSNRDWGAQIDITYVEAADVQTSRIKHEADRSAAAEQDAEELSYIRSHFPLPCGYVRNASTPSSLAAASEVTTAASKCYTENRVISMALYGNAPKYVHGALRNAELAQVYFEGWTLRFYLSADVYPENREAILRACYKCQIMDVPQGTGNAGGMFWRFLVASDPTVDRFIIRDADSRLNARDRLAVEEWIARYSRYPIHIIRDHPNHCAQPISGGLWGGVRGALPLIEEQVKAYYNRDSYGADMNFLERNVWPEIAERDMQVAHDSYCCGRYPNAKPFPSRRPPTYQHVGQVFDALDLPRVRDVEGFMRGMPAPPDCRGKSDWIYG